MSKHTTMIAAFAAVLLASGTAHAAADATGVWIDHTGRGGVEITQCGANLCGKVVWLKEGTDKRGCGIQVIGNVKPVGKDTWDGGWILDPERDAKYSVELKPVGSDKLRVVGYMGSKLFSETMTWKRAPPDLKRCDEGAGDVASTSTDKKDTPAPKNEPAAKETPAKKSGPDASKDKTARSTSTGCTKYFAQIGAVVSVPCGK